MTNPALAHVDQGAPVRADADVTSDAARAALWSVLVNVGNWSTVYPEVKGIEVDGPIVVGATFRFRSGPMAIEGRVTHLEEQRLLAFRGEGKGASSDYAFHLDDAEGGVRLCAAQSMSGLAVRTMKPMLQKIATTSLQDWTQAIAAAATPSP